MKKIQLKIKTLERSQDFSHYKSMGIFPDAQGQVTLQSMVGSGQISNSSKTLWLPLSPAKMKKIPSKTKALECPQHYTAFFQTPRADNFTVGGGIWLKFELIQAFMHILVSCKNEDDRIKMKQLECSLDFSHYKSMGFSRCPRADNSAVSPWSDLAEFRTCPRCY